MICPHCHREQGSQTSPCPHCSDAHTAQKTTPTEKTQQPIQPEVIHNTRHSPFDNNPFSTSQNSDSGQVQYSFIQFGNLTETPNARLLLLPPFITLALTLAAAFSYGFLGAIGFLFFYTIGSIMGFALKWRGFLKGVWLNPWLVRIAVWGGSWLLVRFFS